MVICTSCLLRRHIMIDWAQYGLRANHTCNMKLQPTCGSLVFFGTCTAAEVTRVRPLCAHYAIVANG